ncbi:hypothetical protein BGX38DRAFT_1178192 [Terfezia claveryi]|nr:hypothetical protein BGX38DRAFT_1178192 [Terfezia claveryi]
MIGKLPGMLWIFAILPILIRAINPLALFPASSPGAVRIIVMYLATFAWYSRVKCCHHNCH